MNRQSLIGVVVVALATIMVPTVASAEHRYGTDRGSRYYGGGGGGHNHGSSSFWNVSVGFGGGGYHGNGWYGTALSFGRAPTYYRGGYSRYYNAPVVYAPSYCAPSYPVVYAAPRVYVAPAPVYYTSPVYTSSYYYSSGGYYCGR